MRRYHLPFFCLLAFISILARLASHPPSTQLAKALQLELRNEVRFETQLGLADVPNRFLTYVRENVPGVLEVHVPSSCGLEKLSVTNKVTQLWLQQPAAPDELQLHIHPFHEWEAFASTHWSGRRQGHHVRWETATPEGPKIWWLAYWDLTRVDRAAAREELRLLLDQANWGGSQLEQLGWQSKTSHTGHLPHPHQMSTRAILEGLERGTGLFHFSLYQGPGNAHPGIPARQFGDLEQLLMGWVREAEAALRQFDEEGMLVD